MLDPTAAEEAALPWMSVALACNGAATPGVQTTSSVLSLSTSGTFDDSLFVGVLGAATVAGARVESFVRKCFA